MCQQTQVLMIIVIKVFLLNVFNLVSKNSTGILPGFPLGKYLRYQVLCVGVSRLSRTTVSKCNAHPRI